MAEYWMDTVEIGRLPCPDQIAIDHAVPKPDVVVESPDQGRQRSGRKCRRLAGIDHGGGLHQSRCKVGLARTDAMAAQSTPARPTHKRGDSNPAIGPADIDIAQLGSVVEPVSIGDPKLFLQHAPQPALLADDLLDAGAIAVHEILRV